MSSGLNFDQIVQQRRQQQLDDAQAAAIAQQQAPGIAAPLPEDQAQGTSLLDSLNLKAQLPGNAGIGSDKLPEGQIPDALLTANDYGARHENDFINRILPSISPQESTNVSETPPEGGTMPPAEKRTQDEEDFKDAEERQGEPLESGTSEAPKDVEEADDKDEEPKEKPEKEENEPEYDTDDLRKQIATSEKNAQGYLNMALMQQNAASAVGRTADTSALRALAANESKKIANSQNLLKATIATDAASINYEKAGVELQNEKDMNDPDSEISKLGRNMYQQLTGQSADENMTYTSLLKTQGLIGKVVAAKTSAEARKSTGEMMARLRADQQARVEQTRMDKRGSDFAKQVNVAVASNRQQLGTHARNINMADRLDDQFGHTDPNKLSKQQVATLTSDYVSMMTGGQPTQASIQKAFPESAAGNAADVAAWITGDPTGRRQGKFVTQMLQGAKSLRAQSQTRIAQSIGLTSMGFQDFMTARPEQSQKILDAAIKQISPLESADKTATATTSGMVRVQSPLGMIYDMTPEKADIAVKQHNYRKL